MTKNNIGARIVQILLERQPEFVSGQQLSEQLNCSRTAIWKHIRLLEQEGYRFEAVSRRGYRLLEQPERLNLSGWEEQLNTAFIGKNIHYYKQITSTQKLALELARKEASEGTTVIAEEQTEGRGRFDRTWYSPLGKGLYFSIVLKPKMPLQFIPQLTLLFSVALCRTIRQETGLDAGIKWPNDIMIRDKKVAGILLESNAEDIRVHHVIAGVGINVNFQAHDFQDELQNVATSLRIESGKEMDRVHLLRKFMEELEKWYFHFQKQGFKHIRMLWEALNITLDRHVTVKSGDHLYTGIATAIDETGALILKTESGTMKCYSGETTIHH